MWKFFSRAVSLNGSPPLSQITTVTENDGEGQSNQQPWEGVMDQQAKGSGDVTGRGHKINKMA